MILKTLSEMIVPFILYGMIYNFTLSMLYVVHNNVEIIYNDVFMYINNIVSLKTNPALG